MWTDWTSVLFSRGTFRFYFYVLKFLYSFVTWVLKGHVETTEDQWLPDPKLLDVMDPCPLFTLHTRPTFTSAFL